MVDYADGTHLIHRVIDADDEVPNPDRLGMMLWLNGELQQDANTGR